MTLQASSRDKNHRRLINVTAKRFRALPHSGCTKQWTSKVGNNKDHPMSWTLPERTIIMPHQHTFRTHVPTFDIIILNHHDDLDLAMSTTWTRTTIMSTKKGSKTPKITIRCTRLISTDKCGAWNPTEKEMRGLLSIIATKTSKISNGQHHVETLTTTKGTDCRTRQRPTAVNET